MQQTKPHISRERAFTDDSSFYWVCRGPQLEGRIAGTSPNAVYRRWANLLKQNEAQKQIDLEQKHDVIWVDN